MSGVARQVLRGVRPPLNVGPGWRSAPLWECCPTSRVLRNDTAMHQLRCKCTSHCNSAAKPSRHRCKHMHTRCRIHVCFMIISGVCRPLLCDAVQLLSERQVVKGAGVQLPH